AHAPVRQPRRVARLARRLRRPRDLRALPARPRERPERVDRHAPRRAGRPTAGRRLDRLRRHERAADAPSVRDLAALDGAVSDIAAFVLREARLLDEQRYAEWLELFAQDAVYWIPTQ